MANQTPRRGVPPGPPPGIGPPAAPPPLPSTPDFGAHQSGGDDEISQETGTGNVGRANWSRQMKVYLIELLKRHDVPRYRTHNAWSKEAWKSITSQFNQKFSSGYSVGQVKQKEQDMKKEYRVVKDLSGESGFGWDNARKMVTAKPEVWESLKARKSKDALRWRDKSYPFYDDMFALYEGRYAEGRSCHGMDHYANKAKEPVEIPASFSPMLHIPDSQLESPGPTLSAPGGSSLNFEVGEGGSRDDTNWFGCDAFSPVSNLGNESAFVESSEGANAFYSQNQASLAQENRSETQCFNARPSSSTPQVADTKRQKRQKTCTNTSTEDFQERFLRLKKEEIERFAAIEEKKMDDPYSIKKCVIAIEGMADLLQIEDMIKSADIFKDNPANREVFLSFSSNELRLGWLRRQL